MLQNLLGSIAVHVKGASDCMNMKQSVIYTVYSCRDAMRQTYVTTWNALKQVRPICF